MVVSYSIENKAHIFFNGIFFSLLKSWALKEGTVLEYREEMCMECSE